jgi:hypothetical protein
MMDLFNLPDGYMIHTTPMRSQRSSHVQNFASARSATLEKASTTVACNLHLVIAPDGSRGRILNDPVCARRVAWHHAETGSWVEDEE